MFCISFHVISSHFLDDLFSNVRLTAPWRRPFKVSKSPEALQGRYMSLSLLAPLRRLC